ncbi:MAG: transposase [Acidimicrobiales bacterium]
MLHIAHHLRELKAAGSTEGQGWATDMATLLSATWQLVLEATAAGQRSLSDEVLAEVCENYKSIIATCHVANPAVAPSGKRGRTKRSKAHNLLLRFDAYEDDVLRFATDFAVPFDNNLCERDVRMVKIAQKISGGFRSTEGAEAFLALRSYLSTAAKQGMNRLEALQRLFNGDTWMPATPGVSP